MTDEKKLGFIHDDGQWWDLDIACWSDDEFIEAHHATLAELERAGFVPASSLLSEADLKNDLLDIAEGKKVRGRTEAGLAAKKRVAELEELQLKLASERAAREHLEEAARLLRESLDSTFDGDNDAIKRMAREQREWLERDQATPAPPSEGPASPVAEVGTAEYWHDRFSKCLAMLEGAQRQLGVAETEAEIRRLALVAALDQLRAVDTASLVREAGESGRLSCGDHAIVTGISLRHGERVRLKVYDPIDGKWHAELANGAIARFAPALLTKDSSASPVAEDDGDFPPFGVHLGDSASLEKLRMAIDDKLVWPDRATEENGDYEAAVRHSGELATECLKLREQLRAQATCDFCLHDVAARYCRKCNDRILVGDANAIEKGQRIADAIRSQSTPTGDEIALDGAGRDDHDAYVELDGYEPPPVAPAAEGERPDNRRETYCGVDLIPQPITRADARALVDLVGSSHLRKELHRYIDQQTPPASPPASDADGENGDLDMVLEGLIRETLRGMPANAPLGSKAYGRVVTAWREAMQKHAARILAAGRNCQLCGGDGYYKGPRLGDEACPGCHGGGKSPQSPHQADVLTRTELRAALRNMRHITDRDSAEKFARLAELLPTEGIDP